MLLEEHFEMFFCEKRTFGTHLAATVLRSSSLIARRTSALCLSIGTLSKLERSCSVFRRSFVRSP